MYEEFALNSLERQNFQYTLFGVHNSSYIFSSTVQEYNLAVHNICILLDYVYAQ